MTVQNTDLYIVSRGDNNHQIDALRLKRELGGDEAGTIMAFYQSAAPFGWEQIPDAQYKVGSTVRTYNSVQSTLFSDAGGTLQNIMKSRTVPIPVHSHGFSDSGHTHANSTLTHKHGVTDPKHNHVMSRSAPSTSDYALDKGVNEQLPDSSIYNTSPSSVPDTNIDGKTSLMSTRAQLNSSKTKISVNNGSGSGGSSGAKTGVSISNSADNSNNFSIKYCDVILCKKK